MSQEKLLTERYILPDIKRILDRKSKNAGTVYIGDEDIQINGKPIVAYILSSLFNENIGEAKNYSEIFAEKISQIQDRIEAEAVFYIGSGVFYRDRIKFIQGYDITMEDTNEILAKNYGPFLSRQLRNVTYVNELDRMYDIYHASEVLKVLFINLPMVLVNKIPAVCHNYLDIIALPSIDPFANFCSSNPVVCNIKVIDKKAFALVSNTDEFKWIKGEIVHPDIFNHVFEYVKESRKAVQENVRKVNLLTQYMISLALKEPENYDLYIQQMTTGLQRPFSADVLQYADEVSEFVKLGLIKGLASQEEDPENPQFETVIDPSKIGGRKIAISRYEANISEPSFKIFALDHPLESSGWRDIGTFAMRELMVRFLAINSEDAEKIILDSTSYANLVEQFGIIRNVILRNMLAKLSMTALNTWLNFNPDAVEKYAGKRLVFKSDMNFLSQEPNFIGKCLEDMIENYSDIESSPTYNPLSPEPQVPTTYELTSDAIPKPFTDWVDIQYKSFSKVEDIVSDVKGSSLGVMDFFRVFYNKFQMSSSKSLKKYLESYKFPNYTSKFLVGSFLSTITDLMEMFYHEDDVPLFEKFVEEGRQKLSQPVKDKDAVVSKLAIYISAFLLIEKDQGIAIAKKMVFQNESEEETTNRLNFFQECLDSIKNPKNPYTLKALLRKIVLFPQDDKALPLVAQITKAIDNYPSDRREALSFILSGKPDPTFPHVANYILNTSKGKGLESLHKRAAQYVQS
jgi:hypothetical protein